MPCRSANARARPGVGEATATTSPSSARMRQDAQWMSAWKPEPMTPILTLFMTLLGSLPASCADRHAAGGDESGAEAIPVAAENAEAELDAPAAEVVGLGRRHQQRRAFR